MDSQHRQSETGELDSAELEAPGRFVRTPQMAGGSEDDEDLDDEELEDDEDEDLDDDDDDDDDDDEDVEDDDEDDDDDNDDDVAMGGETQLPTD